MKDRQFLQIIHDALTLYQRERWDGPVRQPSQSVARVVLAIEKEMQGQEHRLTPSIFMGRHCVICKETSIPVFSAVCGRERDGQYVSNNENVCIDCLTKELKGEIK